MQVELFPNFHVYMCTIWLPFDINLGDKLCWHLTIGGFDLFIVYIKLILLKQFCNFTCEIVT